MVHSAHERSAIENGVHGHQMIAYKLLRYLNSTERDRAQLNTITENQWIEHCTKLWFVTTEEDSVVSQDDMSLEVDPITKEKLEVELNKLRNRKATGLDRINSELLKLSLIHI